jgi:hypothetical protein
MINTISFRLSALGYRMECSGAKESVTGAHRRSQNCVQNSTQMSYDGLKYVPNFLCFTFETMLIINRDIDVFPWLPIKFMMIMIVHSARETTMGSF